MEIKEIIKNFLLKGENLIDLLSTAFYSSPWFYGAIDKEKYGNLIQPTSECREEKWADVLKGNGKMIVIDAEDDDTEHEISLQDIINAFEIIIIKHPKLYARLIEQEDDFYDADAVIQYAVFGEWVYG